MTTSVPPSGFGGNPVTTRGPGYIKPFSFSYSKLKNFETCPLRHYKVDLTKEFKEEEGESLQWGNAVHKALANRLAKGTGLPIGMERYAGWCDRLLTPGGKLLVEQQLAIDEDFAPTEWFDSDARKKGKKNPWYRGIGDVIKIYGPVALGVDWKTGKVLEDAQQLALLAACIFAHYPEVMKVRTEFVWLMHDTTTREDFHRNDMPAMWRHLWPRIEALKHAHDTTSYPAKQGGLCRRYCPVTSCPHNGANQ
jgi:hypothetical protein